jgi:hypothetical protein
MLNQLASLARIDFRPQHGQPRMSRVLLAASPLSPDPWPDALLIVIAQAASPLPGDTYISVR